jgi:alternative ribosome-rescue factor
MKKPLPHQHQRGEIQDNMLKAVVTSPLFRTRVVKAKKGKGSYNRHDNRHDKKGRQSQDSAPFSCLLFCHH